MCHVLRDYELPAVGVRTLHEALSKVSKLLSFRDQNIFFRMERVIG